MSVGELMCECGGVDVWVGSWCVSVGELMCECGGVDVWGVGV